MGDLTGRAATQAELLQVWPRQLWCGLIPSVNLWVIMPNLAEVLRDHVNYTAWANVRLIEAASVLSHQELLRDFATADHNVLGTLAHIYAADRLWLGRIEGSPPARFLVPEQDMHMAVLRSEWPALLERWKKWGGLLSEESIHRNISYLSLKGDAFVTPTWQIVLHVVNHGTHHRGQVSGFLRAIGQAPPSLDLVLFYRETLR